MTISRKPIHITCCVILCGLLLYSAAFMPYRSTHTEIDADTGTIRHTTSWFLGIHSRILLQPSFLEDSFSATARNWALMHVGSRTLIGIQSMGSGSSDAPARVVARISRLRESGLVVSEAERKLARSLLDRDDTAGLEALHERLFSRALQAR